MPYTKTILCLAASRKHEGYCFAGKDIRTGEWIRPVSDRPDEEISYGECAISAGVRAKLLDILEVPFVRAAPDDYQTENHRIDLARNWKKKGEGTRQQIEAALDDQAGPLWLNGSASWGYRNNRVAHSEALRFDHSLVLIRPRTLAVSIGPKGGAVRCGETPSEGELLARRFGLQTCGNRSSHREALSGSYRSHRRHDGGRALCQSRRGLSRQCVQARRLSHKATKGPLNVPDTTVYTIGHSTHSIERFIELLKTHSITAVCDVRSTPYSRMNPQFNRETLRDDLQINGIKYVFLGKELGARSDDPACYRDGKVQYDLLAKTALFERGLDRVTEGAKEIRVALMCAEKDPLQCHRTILVARHLAERGMAVRHILASGDVENHEQSEMRLLKTLKLPSTDLFIARDEMIRNAYRMQADAIAYSIEKERA